MENTRGENLRLRLRLHTGSDKRIRVKVAEELVIMVQGMTVEVLSFNPPNSFLLLFFLLTIRVGFL